MCKSTPRLRRRRRNPRWDRRRSPRRNIATDGSPFGASVAVVAALTNEYSCVPEELGSFADRFIELSACPATAEWLDETRGAARWRLGLAALGRKMMSDYDVNALLGIHEMWVLSTAQWSELLGSPVGGRLLDIGAGAGVVTAQLAPLFDEVHTTELSAQMAKQLRRRGYHCHEIDVASAGMPEGPGAWRTIALLNVIDRTNYPMTLLRTVAAAQPEWVLAAVPLPLRPHVHVGPLTVDPEEVLPVTAGRWEAQVNELGSLFETLGLRVQSISRVPYFCRGSRVEPVMALDDAVFVLRPNS